MVTSSVSSKPHHPGFGATTKAFRQARRYNDVLTILARHGFWDIVDVLRGGRRETAEHRKESAPSAGGRAPTTRAERLRRVIEELGPTYVKMGQVLSTRADLVPPDFLTELAKLQDQVPPFSFEDVKGIIEIELGAPLLEVFDSFDPEPLASASLGQVHRARLGEQEVVVKVQRPGIREIIDADIDFMMGLASLLENHVPGWDVHQPTRAVTEFANTIAQELDYEVEAAHQGRFARQFEGNPTVYVPRVFLGLSTSHVLTMEYIDGVKVTDLDELRVRGIDRREVARRGFQLVLQQTLVDGFFHGDPHPGNIFVLPENVLCFIDFGMMGRLSQRFRDDFAELIYHIVDENAPLAAQTIVRLASEERAVDASALEKDVARFMDSYIGRPLKSLGLSTLLRDILDELARHELRIPSDLFLMLKAISEIEGVALSLDPDFDVAKEAGPHVRRIFLDRFRPRRVAENLADAGRELALLLRDTPGLLRQVSEQIRSGEIRVELQQKHLPDVLRVSDQIGNRLAFAFVLGSSLVGSALVAAAKLPPLWNEISILGLGGFLVALVMSAWLLVSILRHGRL